MPRLVPDGATSQPVIVDLGARAPIPTLTEQWIAIPLRAHAVVAPRPGQDEDANLLQHAVLGLLQTGLRDLVKLGHRLALRQELVEIVLGDLRAENWIDDDLSPTTAGILAIQEPGRSLDYTQLWTFQEPWNGRLLPRFVEDLEVPDASEGGRGTIKVVTGSVGNPRTVEAAPLRPQVSEYRALRMEEFATAYGEFQEHRHRADVADGGGTWEKPVNDPRIAVIHGRVLDVLVLTFCFTSNRLPLEREWDVADPLGIWWLTQLSDCIVRDMSPELGDVIGRLRGDGRSHADRARVKRRHQRGVRVAKRGLAPSESERLTDAWSDVGETLIRAREVRNRLADKVREERHESEGPVRHLCRLVDEATGRVSLLAEEALRQALGAAAGGDRADLRFSWLEAEKQAYREAAGRCGFDELPDVLVVRGRRALGDVGRPRGEGADTSPDGSPSALASRLPELVLLNLTQAATDPRHALRSIAARRPRLLVELGALVKEETWGDGVGSTLASAADDVALGEVLRGLVDRAADAIGRLEELAATLALGETAGEAEGRHG